MFNSTTAAPTLQSNVIGTFPGVRFDGVNDHWRSQSFTLPQPFTAYFVIANAPTGNSDRLCDGNTVNRAVVQTFNTAANGARLYGLFGGSAEACAAEGAINSEVLASVFNGASSSLRCGKRTKTTGSIGTLGYNDGMILAAAGGLNAGFFLAIDVLHVLLYSVAHDDTQQETVRAGLASLWPIKPELRFVGDSLTYGTPYTPGSGSSYPEQMYPLIGGASTYDVNSGGTAVGAPSRTIQNMAGAIALDHGRYTSGLRPNDVWLVQGGTNDIIIGGRTAAQIYADHQTIWAAARATGSTVVAHTITPSGLFSGAQETIRTDANTLIRAGGAFYDALSDVAADPRLDDPLDATYYNQGGDMTHPTVAGYAAWAEVAEAAIEPLL
jgi:lysophospholipase L1-like esterase